MRFIGLLGLLVLMGIGFLFSNNRRKIPIRVIVWGLGLQFLMVLIVLGNRDQSWVGMSIFLFALLLYTYQHRLKATASNTGWILPAILIGIAGGVAVAIGMGLALIGILPYLIVLSIIVMIVGIRMRRPEISRSATCIMLAWVLALIITSGTSAYRTWILPQNL